jgi:hypothetical protein
MINDRHRSLTDHRHQSPTVRPAEGLHVQPPKPEIDPCAPPGWLSAFTLRCVATVFELSPKLLTEQATNNLSPRPGIAIRESYESSQ